MQTDEFGRSFLVGDEEGPNDIRCVRCGKTPYLNGNPFGAYIFEFSRADHPHHISAFSLCDPCGVEFWEWVTPMLTTRPDYIAKKDQHLANIKEFQKEWNSQAPDDEQIPDV